jgi:hypothetical protein
VAKVESGRIENLGIGTLENQSRALALGRST